MARAVLCPVCLGKGTVPESNYTSSGKKQCHGCNGRGWVEVNDPMPIPAPYHPYPWTYTYHRKVAF